VLRSAKGPAGTKLVSFDLGALLEHPDAGDLPLEEGDVVRIYATADLAGVREVTIDGLVNKPGTYQYSDDLTLEDLVVLAGGLRPEVSRPEAMVARPVIEAGASTDAADVQSQRSIVVTLAREVASVPREGRTALQAADRVTVRHASGWEPLDVAAIRGEVRFSGSYSLPRREQRLSDLVALGGGLKDEAFPEAATLQRREFVAGAGLGEATISVAIDLAAALRQPGGAADIVLRDGDVLLVPKSPGVVMVRGAVQRPMALQHRTNATLQDYLALTGGPSPRADTSRITITAPNNTAMLVAKGQNPVLSAGSVVDVPLVRSDERLRVVEVKGAVGTPAVVQFIEGAPLSYYVGVCGGFAANADLDRVVVLAPDGGMLAGVEGQRFNPEIPPGSIVVVTARAVASEAPAAK
jgi:protein involved in polysaccharide export with SLBB domain